MPIIAQTTLWNIVHLDIAVSYVLFIPFVIGAAASFTNNSPLVRIGTPLIIVAAAIGLAQILTHLTMFKYLADTYVATSDPALRQNIVFLYNVLWPYAVALEVAHLLVIDVAGVMFGIAMLDEALYPQWVGQLGAAGGIIAAVGLLAGKFGFGGTQRGDVIFGVTLIPLVIWIIATGIVLLRADLEPSGALGSRESGGDAAKLGTPLSPT